MKTQNEGHMQAWIQELKKGDGAAYRQLYDRYAGSMYNLCLRITGDPEDANDVLQESFAKVFEKIGQLKSADFFPAWIRKVCVNTALQFVRHKRQLRFEDFETHADKVNASEEAVLLSESDDARLIDCIHEGIAELPDRYRIVFTLYALEDYSHEEIGRELGIVAGTSRSQYLRAKQKLLEIVKRKYSHGGQTERLHPAIKA